MGESVVRLLHCLSGTFPTLTTADCCPSAARPPSHSCSASSARSAARFAPVRTVAAVDASLASRMVLAGAWSGRGEAAAPPEGRQPGSRSPGRSHLRPSQRLTERTSRSSRPPPSRRYGAAPVASCTAAQTHHEAWQNVSALIPTGERPQLLWSKPWPAITRPACCSPPSRGSSKGHPCCLIRHRPSRRYHRNRRSPRSRNRRSPRSRNRRYHRNRPRRSGRRLGVIRLQLQPEPSRGSHRHDGSRTPP
jgi:hypothetical protein